MFVSLLVPIYGVGLFALRRTSLLGVASGYTSSILVLTQVTSNTCGNDTSITTGCWPLYTYPLAHCIYYTTIQIYTSLSRYDTTNCCFCSCIHCYECQTRDHGALYTLDNRFQVNSQSIGSYSNRRPIAACDRYRLALFEACCGWQ